MARCPLRWGGGSNVRRSLGRPRFVRGRRPGGRRGRGAPPFGSAPDRGGVYLLFPHRVNRTCDSDQGRSLAGLETGMCVEGLGGERVRHASSPGWRTRPPTLSCLCTGIYDPATGEFATSPGGRRRRYLARFGTSLMTSSGECVTRPEPPAWNEVWLSAERVTVSCQSARGSPAGSGGLARLPTWAATGNRRCGPDTRCGRASTSSASAATPPRPGAAGPGRRIR
jgi:hypothetical protein